MSDFPSLGTTAGGQAAANAGAFGLFDQNTGGVVGGGAMNEQIQTTNAPGGDLFSAGQTDLFGGDGSAAAGMLKNGGDGDAAAAEMVASAASNVAGKTSSTATPPPRPPPPATAVAAAANGAVPRALSPTAGIGGGASHGRPAVASATVSAAAAGAPPTNKSAFDDLNDSIRMALGGSPSRPVPMVQQQQATIAAAQQQPLQQQMPAATGMFGMSDVAGQPVMSGAPIVGYGIPTQAQVPVGYGSPAKQPMSGDGNA